MQQEIHGSQLNTPFGELARKVVDHFNLAMDSVRLVF